MHILQSSVQPINSQSAGNWMALWPAEQNLFPGLHFGRTKSLFEGKAWGAQ